MAVAVAFLVWFLTTGDWRAGLASACFYALAAATALDLFAVEDHA